MNTNHQAYLGCAFLLLTACGSSAEPDVSPDPSSGYAAPPYGTAVGETIANLKFTGFAPTDYNCTPNAQLKPDLAKPATITLRDWRDGATQCAMVRRRLLWLFITGGW